LTSSELARRVLQGDRRALARALTLVENCGSEARELVSELFPHAGRAMVIGLTGPPGVGKSTLADALASRARAAGRRVAILATDPSSPFTGGALLGDRIRMEAGSRDPEIFIRSMATRGKIGGLSASAFEAIAVLESSGRDFILVETVGVGQDELDVVAAARLTVVVLAPGLGDEIQAAKAGLLEAADLVVVNKADREGAERLVGNLELALGLAGTPPRILRTVATAGEGLAELLAELTTEYERLAARDPSRRRRSLDGWLRELVARRAVESAQGEAWEEALDALLDRSLDPFGAAERVLAAIRGSGEEDR
jgi:LAO/AO transport system kinase